MSTEHPAPLIDMPTPRTNRGVEDPIQDSCRCNKPNTSHERGDAAFCKVSVRAFIEQRRAA